MKILFICKANVGRSQMAEEIFNSTHKEDIAISAGLNPPEQWLGKKLSETKYVAPCMKEIGLDVNEKVSKKLTEEMVLESDKIVVLGEKDNWPDYLKKANPMYWDMIDPDIGEMELTRTIRDRIIDKLKTL